MTSLSKGKPLVNSTLQVITSRKGKNMPKTNQAKRKAPYIDLDNPLKKCLVYGAQVKRKAGKLGKSLAKDKNTENLGKSSQQEWERDAQEWMDKLSIIDLEILNSIVYHKLASQQERIIDRVSEMKTYHEWASKRDNQIHDKTIDDVLDLDIFNSL